MTLPDGRTVEVDIPAGVESGQTLRVAGQGMPAAAKKGGTPGSLFVDIQVQPHPQFERQGPNLFLSKRVSVLDAMLGTTVEVPTLSGKAELRMHAGTQQGDRFRMRGYGMPQLGGRGKGDLFVVAEYGVMAV